MIAIFLVVFDVIYLICLFLRGCSVPAELYGALQHTVTGLHNIPMIQCYYKARLHSGYYDSVGTPHTSLWSCDRQYKRWDNSLMLYTICVWNKYTISLKTETSSWQRPRLNPGSSGNNLSLYHMSYTILLHVPDIL